MPLQSEPKLNATQYHMLRIDKPCWSGLNLDNLEYEQDNDQASDMLNLMYRNGTLGKRFGQELAIHFTDRVNAFGKYMGKMFYHVKNSIYKENTAILSNVPNVEGQFINFNKMLYYMVAPSSGRDGMLYEYDGTTFHQITPYIPDIIINRKPDGSYAGDTIEDYNLLGGGFKNTFHGDGISKEYILTTTNIDTSPAVKVEVDNVELATNTYSVDYAKGKVTFNTAPLEGVNNVVITAYKRDKSYENKIYNCKYHVDFGGANNSRLMLAGGGDAKYYYSYPFDATYFPETQWGTLGNSEEDITGFGKQYSTLVVFKPSEMYALSYYVQGSEAYASGVGAFTSTNLNANVGCDCPKSIQLINSQLVWLSSKKGVMTLASTNVSDEKNVRPISTNIEGGIRRNGLLQEADLTKAVSVDYNNKYILCVNGKAYVWDYFIAPYYNSGKIEADSKRCAWFLWDNIYADDFLELDGDLYFRYGTDVNKFNNEYNDYGNAIHAIFRTPSYLFGAPEYLKSIKNIYVQIRGDVRSSMDITYITDDDETGAVEQDPIRTSGNEFGLSDWDNFSWIKFRSGKTFMRKCSIKKVQYLSVLFENNVVNEDMTISHLAFEYYIVKTIK